MEITHWQKDGIKGAPNVVSLPWMTKATKSLLNTISVTLKKLGAQYGPWRFFVNMKDLSSHAAQEKAAIENLPFCSFEHLSDQYFNALQKAKILITYGGYNSLCDVIAAGVPAIVVTRTLNDQEQEEHVKRLQEAAGEQIIHLKEGMISPEMLDGAIKSQAYQEKIKRPAIKLSGAEETAHILANYLKS
jgi:predicted glycosyltransferase